MYRYIMLISAMLVLDAIWIYGFMGSLYKNNLGNFFQFSEGMRLYLSLLLVYGLMVLGLFMFVLKPGVSWIDAGLYGGILYGVFAMTNFIIFSNWPIVLVVADTIWGAVLYTSMWFLAKLIGFI